MSTKVRIQRKGQQYEVEHKENYVPFSNLSLCPKTVIALVQSSIDPQELENTLNGLKAPTSTKHYEYLHRMRLIADKQENFTINRHESSLTTVNQECEQSYQSYGFQTGRKNSEWQCYQDSYYY